MDFPSKAKGWLMADMADIASDPSECAMAPGSDFTRERKLGLAELMLMLVTMGTGSLSHELMEHFSCDPGRMPAKSALCQQRAKLLPSAMRRLLRAFAFRLGLSEYREGWALVAVDGSTFCLGPDRSDGATCHPNREGCRGRNDVHAVALQDAVGGHCIDAVGQDGREKDGFSAMCALVDDWPRSGCEGPRPIFVADRGFAGRNVFAHVIEAGMHFAIRAKGPDVERMLRPGGGVALPDGADWRVDLILSRTNAITKVARPDRIADYRRIAGAGLGFLPDGVAEYPISLRIVRFPIGDGRFENIVTNLPADDFAPGDVREIYGMRWSIETSFRRLRHDIGANEPHSRKAQLAKREIFARLVLYDFCVAVAGEVGAGRAEKRGGRKHAHATSFSDACRACCAYLRGRARAPSAERIVAGSTSPVRPGRLFSRRHRLRSPSGYAYRPA